MTRAKGVVPRTTGTDPRTEGRGLGTDPRTEGTVLRTGSADVHYGSRPENCESRCDSAEW